VSQVGKSNTTFTAPFASGIGNYFVSVTNLSHGKSLIVDAVSVFNTNNLAQGIYQETNPGLTFGPAPTSWLTA
jgi:hypothetical protein